MKKTDYRLLALALTSFLFFQAVLIYHVRVTDYDEAVFLDIARNIQRVGLPLRSVGTEGVFYFIHTPLYLYFVTASVMLLGDNPLLARLVTTLFALGSIVLTYLTVRHRKTAVSSFVAALLLALNTFVAIYAYFLTMEVPMMFFIILAIYWLSKTEISPSWRYWLGAGMAAATAVLLKELALIFVAAAALYAFAFGPTWRARFTHSLWFVLPIIAALALWAWWGINLNQSQFLNSITGWVGFVSGANNVAGSRNLQTISWMRVLSGDVFGAAMLIMFAAAIPAYFLWFRRKLPQIIWLLFLYLGLAVGLSFLISLKEPRHVMALIPVMAMIIGLMIEWDVVWDWARQKQLRFVVALGITLLVVWNISPFKLPPPTEWQQMEKWWEPMFAQRSFDSQRYYGLLKETGEYLADHTPPDTVIAVVHEGPVIGYYADRPHYFLYNMRYPQIMDVLEDTEYLIFDHQVFVNLTPTEITAVMTYIETEFELEQLMKDTYREARIYHRQN